MLFPTSYLSSVVAIGVTEKNGAFKLVGTGFLYSSKRGTEDRTVVVTNRHVMDRTEKGRVFRFDLRKGDRHVIGKETGSPWVAHPDSSVDAAAALFAPALMSGRTEQYSSFASENTVRGRNSSLSHTIGEGDGVFIPWISLGFGRRKTQQCGRTEWHYFSSTRLVERRRT